MVQTKVPSKWQTGLTLDQLSSVSIANLSEAVEHGEWIRHVLAELYMPPGTSLRVIEKVSEKRRLIVPTDSENLSVSVNRDAGVVADKRLRIVISMLRESAAAGMGHHHQVDPYRGHGHGPAHEAHG